MGLPRRGGSKWVGRGSAWMGGARTTVFVFVGWGRACPAGLGPRRWRRRPRASRRAARRRLGMGVKQTPRAAVAVGNRRPVRLAPATATAGRRRATGRRRVHHHRPVARPPTWSWAPARLACHRLWAPTVAAAAALPAARVGTTGGPARPPTRPPSTRTRRWPPHAMDTDGPPCARATRPRRRAHAAPRGGGGRSPSPPAARRDGTVRRAPHRGRHPVRGQRTGGLPPHRPRPRRATTVPYRAAHPARP